LKYVPKHEKEIMCPLEHGLDVFGGKWKSRIICVLSTKDVMRYNEIRKELGNITDGVLTAMLKELTEDKIIDRKQYNEIPARVEYALTEEGKTVLPILTSICQWSRMHSTEDLDKRLTPCTTCEY
jgi:DNA-binding HxlR family transcriptional regulator